MSRRWSTGSNSNSSRSSAHRWAGSSRWAMRAAHPHRLKSLVINDIGPDAEHGSQRITQTVGSRPDSFATLEAALQIPPRDLADHRGAARGRPARTGARRAAGGQRWALDVEDGPGLH